MGYDSLNSYFYMEELGAAKRLYIKDGGNVGIGQPSPSVPLQFGNIGGNKVSFFQSGSNHYGIGTQAGLLQVFTPTNTDDIALGYGNSNSFTEVVRIKGSRQLEVKNNSGTPVIQLDGNTGNITAANLPAIASKTSLVNYNVPTSIAPGLDLTLTEMDVTIPGAGYIQINCSFDSYLKKSFYSTPPVSSTNMHIKIDEYTTGNSFVATLKKYDFLYNEDFFNPSISVVIPVNNTGTKRLRFLLYKSGDGPSGVIYNSYMTVTYYPQALSFN